MLVNSCPILNLHIPPITVSCALPGRVAWLHCVQFNPDGWHTESREPPTRTHIHDGVCSSVVKEQMTSHDKKLIYKVNIREGIKT